MRLLLCLAALLAPGAAWADTHGVTVANRSGETIRQIHIAPAGAGTMGENRLRSQVPPNAEARITYSTGCAADVRVGFEGGRTELFPNVDVCADPRLATGGGTASSATIGPARPPGAAPTATPATSGRPTTARNAAAANPATPVPPVVVPPWTGRSITRRFGGMD